MDLEEQYDKIYRYCYFKVHHRETAEDITQEAFLRFFKSCPDGKGEEAIRFLYAVAHNLCVDAWRKKQPGQLQEEPETAAFEGGVLKKISVQTALGKLSQEDRELLLLRYVNEAPVSVIGNLQGISRFAARRKILKAVQRFKKYLEEEDIP